MAFVVNRLSLKLAAFVGVLAAALLLAVRYALAPPVPLWSIPALVLLLGGATYAAAHRMLARRLKQARSTLRQIRRHQFDNLEAPHLPHGDELNDLVWQVCRTGRVLEKEIHELKKMENHRREFIGNVSHELKTPIFSIQGFAETLLDGALEDGRVNRSFVEKILRNAGRLNNLAQDLAEIARIETGALQMTAAPFDLGKLAAEVTESLEMTAQTKEVALQYAFPHDLPPVVGDRERIRQVLINLVDNAVKYNNPGGRVVVSAEHAAPDQVKTSVTDDGIGIAPQHVARLTERFYRVDQSRSRNQGGTGLGLAIVKHILGAHESRLVVESAPGQGATFSFTLPAAQGLRSSARGGAEDKKHATPETLAPSAS